MSFTSDNLPVPTVQVLDRTKLIRVKGMVPVVNQEGDKDHNPREPIFVWYQDTPEGKEINIALYTKPCSWGRCSFCTLPSQSSPVGVRTADILAQTQSAFDRFTPEQLAPVRRVFLSNNGSVLDKDTLPLGNLRAAIRMAHERCPNLQIICLETRFDSVGPTDIEPLHAFLLSCHGESEGRLASMPVALQFSGGYETQDPYLRNAVLFKGYAEEKVQDFFALCSEAAKRSDQTVLLDEYVILKPAAGLTDAEAVAEAVESILHLDRLGSHFSIPVSIRLNPAFAAVGSELHAQFQRERYTPPTLRDICQVIVAVRDRGCELPIFVGLNDEGLVNTDSERFGNRDHTDVEYHSALLGWNKEQNPGPLRDLLLGATA